jgi:hypothetical protein
MRSCFMKQVFQVSDHSSKASERFNLLPTGLHPGGCSHGTRVVHTPHCPGCTLDQSYTDTDHAIHWWNPQSLYWDNTEWCWMGHYRGDRGPLHQSMRDSEEVRTFADLRNRQNWRGLGSGFVRDFTLLVTHVLIFHLKASRNDLPRVSKIRLDRLLVQTR